MLKRLSYFNLIFSILYMLVYLKNGTINSVSGIMTTIVFNWLYLRSDQLADYKWGILYYLTGLWSLYYAGKVCYGAINVLFSSIEYDFITNDTLLFLVLSFIFCIGVIVHFGFYLAKGLRRF